ncbi:hypothetical protein DM860_018123 [Cuscuta australis]|uniref:Fe2OG dioxygenase domain-containing protein n=1 Tax=Cuscuta australis TaxID=267555 RepID=A0A328DVM4_9ASTE|nr:hypothetical protein DM860_018123 [Cuscuta australis]
MAYHQRTFMDDSFLLEFCQDELRIAAEFLSIWLPFLSRDLCHSCTQALADRILSIDPEARPGEYHLKQRSRFDVSTPENTFLNGHSRNKDNLDSHSGGSWVDDAIFNDTAETNSLGSWKEGLNFNGTVDANSLGNWKEGVNLKDTADTNSLGSWKEGANLKDTADTNSLGSWKEDTCLNFISDVNDTSDTHSLGSWNNGVDRSLDRDNGVSMKAILSENLRDAIAQASAEGSTSEIISSPRSAGSQKVKMSWADMAQENELEDEDGTNSFGSSRLFASENTLAVERTTEKVSTPKVELSRELREQIRFCNVKRKKNFLCLERVNGKIINTLDGLELHTGVFSAAEQIRIVNYVEALQEKGKNGRLKERTYTAPAKWMKGKGRVTIQFGCCYNYATDKNGNPPGILRDDTVDPIPQLFKVMIRRLVKWHVVPPTCIPDSCIVNIYDVGDCIPPHIDNHDFVRPFCTVSFLSQCSIVFGLNLNVDGPGQFVGPIAIPLPVGSVLVINGNAADVAKHCVPSVPTKRISITFRRMDESKRPHGYVPEPDLQGIRPMLCEADQPKKDKRHSTKKQAVKREESTGKLIKSSRERPSGSRYAGRSGRRPVSG